MLILIVLEVLVYWDLSILYQIINMKTSKLRTNAVSGISLLCIRLTIALPLKDVFMENVVTGSLYIEFEVFINGFSLAFPTLSKRV